MTSSPGPPFYDPGARPPGPPPAGAAPPYASGQLVLNLRRPFGAMGMITPVVTIDGYPVPTQWGRNAIPAPAGVRQLSVASNYLWTYGRAEAPVTVEPNRSVEVFYAGPLFTFIRGALAPTPPARPGRTGFVALMAVLGLLVVLAIFGAVLAATS